MTKRQGPEEIIDYCLQPLHLNGQSPATQEAIRRLHDAIATLRILPTGGGAGSQGLRKAPPIVINEAAHGYDA